MKQRLDDLEARFEGRPARVGSRDAPIEIESDSEEEVVVVEGESVLEVDDEEGEEEGSPTPRPGMGDVESEGPVGGAESS